MRGRFPQCIGRAAVFVATLIPVACVPPGSHQGPRASAGMRMHAGMMGMGGHAHAAPAAQAFPRAWERWDAEAARPSAHVIVVKMISLDDGDGGKFDPENVTAQAGDTIRFVTDGLSPHNVSFPPAQNAAPLQPPAPVPFLTTAGQTYDMVAPSAAGTYRMQCDPHAFTGMTGTITVQ